eukprot:362692-Chlamydomonas_euryale.AAC.2
MTIARDRDPSSRVAPRPCALMPLHVCGACPCVCAPTHSRLARRAIWACVAGYFMRTPLEEIPRVSIPLHTLLELTPMPGEHAVRVLGDSARAAAAVAATQQPPLHPPPPPPPRQNSPGQAPPSRALPPVQDPTSKARCPLAATSLLTPSHSRTNGCPGGGAHVTALRLVELPLISSLRMRHFPCHPCASKGSFHLQGCVCCCCCLQCCGCGHASSCRSAYARGPPPHSAGKTAATEAVCDNRSSRGAFSRPPSLHPG